MPASAKVPLRKHRSVRRIVRRQAAHEADVLLVVKRVDDVAGTHEQQRLEDRVRHEVEHRRGVGADAHREDHQPDLRHRRVGDDPFDVDLAQRDHPRHDGGADAHARDHALRHRGAVEEWVETGDEIHAGGHHGGGVDQRRHRGRALHGVGEPRVQGELRALGERCDRQQHADTGDQQPAGRKRAATAKIAGMLSVPDVERR